MQDPKEDKIKLSAHGEPGTNSERAKMYLAGEDEDEDAEDRPEGEDEEGVGGEREIAVSYACEDCDYRWEIYLEEEDDEMDDTQYCPMCGSANTSQI